jgi:hypothetical protein
VSSERARGGSIWLFAFGYFAAYVPYAAVTKALTNGAMASDVTGTMVLPLATVVSMLCMAAFLVTTGWWKSAGSVRLRGFTVPVPSRWPAPSGIATASVIVTTTLAYTFAGTSIVLMMLLMRGGVLVIAPMTDRASGRRVRWFSWIGLGLSGIALSHAAVATEGFSISAIAALDVAVYLAAYFLRLRFMSKLAKGSTDDNRRFFVEEQIVATPFAVLCLALIAALPLGTVSTEVAAGFLEVPFRAAAPAIILVGVTSQLTGVFGALVLLDPRENSYCVPVNRGSSIVAGIVGSFILWALGAATLPSPVELAGAGWVALAVTALAVGPRIEARRPAASPSAAQP